jgi:hypothetical protein
MSPKPPRIITYNAEPTPRLFHADDSFVRALMGPIGSGKSVACCAEILKRAHLQKPHNNIRKSRWAVIRNTYRELVDTTLQTFFDWFPKHLGTWRQMDMKWTFSKKLPDNTTVYLEVLFRALDRPDDIKKLLSLELTGGWINEAREIPKQVLDMLQGRVGRFPSSREGGPSWFGIIMDTNPPDSDHWWYKLFEENPPNNFKLFKQPSGLSTNAENIPHLPTNYYHNMMSGKDQEWINVYIHGNYGFIADGKPVWPEYKDDIHVSHDTLDKFGGTIYVGVDFGLTPAAAIGQLLPEGQLQVIDEVVAEDMGAVRFAEQLHSHLITKYCGCEIEIYGDPAGEQRSQVDETTPFQIFWNKGIEIWPAYTNDFTIRREAVADLLTRFTPITGKPAFLLCANKAKMCRKALAGGYKYRRMQVSGQERFQDKPDKGRYSHIGDAIQYMTLGAVGGDRVVGGISNNELDYSTTNRIVV